MYNIIMTQAVTNKITELKEQISILKDNLLTYKMQARGGALKTIHLIKATRRDIARATQALAHEEFMHTLSLWLQEMDSKCEVGAEECALAS